MHSISSNLISVVIQGPLYRRHGPDRGIDACIASVRRHLPDAEIITSTWAREDVDGLDTDQLVISADPGFFMDCSDNMLNTNRQLVSTLAGIKAATRPYVMKLRADLNLTTPALASIGRFQTDSTTGRQRFFKAPITLTTLFIRDPARFPMLYHLSDLAQFGRREDMLTFWDQPMFTEDMVCLSQPRRNPFGSYQGFSRIRMNPEQALMIGMLRKCGLPIHLDHSCQIRTADLDLWEDILSHDFHVLDYEAAGIDFPERLKHGLISPKVIFTAKTIRKIATHTPMQRRLRRMRVWLNQYVLCYGQMAWWISTMSSILFSISPSFAKHVRHIWRKARGSQRPSRDDI